MISLRAFLRFDHFVGIVTTVTSSHNTNYQLRARNNILYTLQRLLSLLKNVCEHKL